MVLMTGVSTELQEVSGNAPHPRAWTVQKVQKAMEPAPDGGTGTGSWATHPTDMEASQARHAGGGTGHRDRIRHGEHFERSHEGRPPVPEREQGNEKPRPVVHPGGAVSLLEGQADTFAASCPL